MRQNTSMDAADMTTASEYVEKLIHVADATLTSPAWGRQRDYAETIALETLREVRRRKTPPWHTIAQMPKGVWMVTRGWDGFDNDSEGDAAMEDRDTWERAVAAAMLEGVVVPRDNIDEMDIDTLAAAVASVLGPESETIKPSGGSGIRGPDHLPIDVNAEELLAYLPTLNVKPQDHAEAVKRWTGVTRVPRGDDAIVDAVTTAKRVLQMATDGAYSPDEDEVPKEERTLTFGRIFKAVATNNSHPIIADEKGYIKGTNNGGAEFFVYGDKTPRGKLTPEQVKKVAREQVIWPPLAFYDESGTLMPPAMVGFNRAAIGLARVAREERRAGKGDYGPATMFGPSKWSPDVKAPVSKGYDRALSEREQAALDREHAARARAAEREERQAEAAKRREEAETKTARDATDRALRADNMRVLSSALDVPSDKLISALAGSERLRYSIGSLEGINENHREYKERLLKARARFYETVAGGDFLREIMAPRLTARIGGLPTGFRLASVLQGTTDADEYIGNEPRLMQTDMLDAVDLGVFHLRRTLNLPVPKGADERSPTIAEVQYVSDALNAIADGKPLPPLPKGAKAPASPERYQPDHRDKAYQAYVSAPEGLDGKLFYVIHQGSTVSQHKTLGDAEAAFHRTFPKEASATVFDGTTGEFISWRDRAAKAPPVPVAKATQDGDVRVEAPPGWRGIMLTGIERLGSVTSDAIFALGDPADGVFTGVGGLRGEPQIVPHRGEVAYSVATVRHKPGYREDGRSSDGAVLLFVPTLEPHWRVVPLGYKNGGLHYSDRVLSQGDFVARVSATKVAEARSATSVSARKEALATRAERITTEAARKAGSRASANATWAGSDAKGYTLRVKTRGFADSFVRGTLDEIEAKLTEAEQRARGGR